MKVLKTVKRYDCVYRLGLKELTQGYFAKVTFDKSHPLGSEDITPSGRGALKVLTASCGNPPDVVLKIVEDIHLTPELRENAADDADTSADVHNSTAFGDATGKNLARSTHGLPGRFWKNTWVRGVQGIVRSPHLSLSQFTSHKVLLGAKQIAFTNFIYLLCL